MKKIAVLMGVAFVDMLGLAMVFPLLPFYALHLDADAWVIGLMIASFSVAQLTSAPIWGRMSDRIGRRPALMIGLAASAIAFLVFGFATTIWMLFLSRIIQGAGGGTTGVAQAYIGDAIEPKERAKALGWLSAATSAGVMIGPVIGSLAFRLGPAWPGIVAAGLCVINIGFTSRWLPETSPAMRRPASAGAHVSQERRSIRAVVWEVLRVPGGQVPQLIWIYAVGMLGFMSMAAILALYLEAGFGVTEHNIWIFFFYVGALSMVMRAIILGKLVARLGETKVMRIGALALALGLAVMPLPSSVPLLLLAMSLVPVGTALLFPSVTALVIHKVSAHERGQVLSVQQTFGGVSRVIAPIWATAVFQGFGTKVPFFMAAGVVAVVALLAFRVVERP
ncbi:MAG: MFS transporter [Gemmatimonadetes bacterium]|nr:MFS transporter [Gemmatimonadota bacterium]